jgi:hypothetical protein
MKIIITLFLAMFGLNMTFAQSTADDLNAGVIEMHDGGERALRELQLLPLDKQSQVVESIIRKLQSISNEPGPLTSDSVTFVSSAAWLFGQIGTDEQIVTAFGNLGGFRNAESDAARGLASCSSSAGVEIMEKLADKRLPNLANAITPTTEEDRKQFDDTFIPFYHLILRLNDAKSSAGQRAALRLRDEFAARYSSDKGKFFLAELDKELTVEGNRRESKKQQPSLAESVQRGVKPPEAMGQSELKSAQTAVDNEKSLSIWVFAVVGIISVIGMLWLWLKKRGRSQH